jgi:hypothetical protein
MTAWEGGEQRGEEGERKGREEAALPQTKCFHEWTGDKNSQP